MPVSTQIALTNALGDDSDTSTVVVDAKEDSSAAESDLNRPSIISSAVKGTKTLYQNASRINLLLCSTV